MQAARDLLLSQAAQRDLKKLPRNIQKEIVCSHLPKIQANAEVGVPLVGVLKGERAYHFGHRPEYRIV